MIQNDLNETSYNFNMGSMSNYENNRPKLVCLNNEKKNGPPLLYTTLATGEAYNVGNPARSRKDEPCCFRAFCFFKQSLHTVDSKKMWDHKACKGVYCFLVPIVSS